MATWRSFKYFCIVVLSILQRQKMPVLAAVFSEHLDTCLLFHNDIEIESVTEVSVCQQLCEDEISFACCSFELREELFGGGSVCSLSRDSGYTHPDKVRSPCSLVSSSVLYNREDMTGCSALTTDQQQPTTGSTLVTSTLKTTNSETPPSTQLSTLPDITTAKDTTTQKQTTLPDTTAEDKTSQRQTTTPETTTEKDTTSQKQTTTTVATTEKDTTSQRQTTTPDATTEKNTTSQRQTTTPDATTEKDTASQKQTTKPDAIAEDTTSLEQTSLAYPATPTYETTEKQISHAFPKASVDVTSSSTSPTVVILHSSEFTASNLGQTPSVTHPSETERTISANPKHGASETVSNLTTNVIPPSTKYENESISMPTVTFITDSSDGISITSQPTKARHHHENANENTATAPETTTRPKRPPLPDDFNKVREPVELIDSRYILSHMVVGGSFSLIFLGFIIIIVVSDLQRLWDHLVNLNGIVQRLFPTKVSHAKRKDLFRKEATKGQGRRRSGRK